MTRDLERLTDSVEWTAFLAEESGWETTPSGTAAAPRLHLMWGEVERLRANTPARLPLWLGRALRRSHAATLLPPPPEEAEPQPSQSQPSESESEELAPPAHLFARERERLGAATRAPPTPQVDEYWGRREALVRRSVTELVEHLARHGSLTPLDVSLDGLAAAELVLVKTLVRRHAAALLTLRL